MGQNLVGDVVTTTVSYSDFALMWAKVWCDVSQTQKKALLEGGNNRLRLRSG
jgi:hypothetical protein